jgi:quinol monooxygenase YgiN
LSDEGLDFARCRAFALASLRIEEQQRDRENLMIYVIATTQMKPESREAFIKGHRACITETLKEKGCIAYEGHVSVNDPNLYVVVERWETREDLNAHARAPHMKVWREIGAPLRTAPPVIEIISDGKVEKL